MDDRTILFENTPSIENLSKSISQGLKLEDVSVIVDSKAPVRIIAKDLVKITAESRVATLIITKLYPIPYSFDKAIPWNYGSDVYIHGVNQKSMTNDATVTNPSDVNIAGTSRIT